MKSTKTKAELLYGFHSVYEVLSARRRLVHRLFLISRKITDRDKQIIILADSLHIDYEFIERSKIRSIMETNEKYGCFALVSPLPIFGIKDFLNSCISPRNLGLLVILDGILDPHNFGAIVRTAYCVGVSGIIITKNRACSPTPTVSKISAGALEHIPICRVTNLSNTIKILKKNGFWIVGMDSMENKMNVFDTNMSGLMAIVIGNEANGLRPLVSEQCDFIVSVPMSGRISSLNASVAAAVVLYESFRQRRRQKLNNEF